MAPTEGYPLCPSFKRLLGLFGFLLILTWPLPSQACLCGTPQNIYNHYENSHAVFLGTALEVKFGKYSVTPLGSKGTDIENREFSKRVTRLHIEKVWKGIQTETVELTSRVTGCGYSFREGVQYLVYASLDEEQAWLTAIYCYRTKPAEEAQAEMMLLDNLKKGIDQKRIYEKLASLSQTHPGYKFRGQALELVSTAPESVAPIDREEVILSGLKDSHPYVRKGTAEIIYDHYYIDINSKVIRTLNQALDAEIGQEVSAPNAMQKESHLQTIRGISFTLAKVGGQPDQKRVLLILLKAFRDKNNPERHRALGALGNVGEVANEIVTELLEILKEKPWTNLHYAAQYALPKLGYKGEWKLP